MGGRPPDRVPARGPAVELAEQVVDTAEESGLPLFAGWRAEPRADGGVARMLQLVHVLREWRGAVHLVATTAAGLGPLEAILTNEGEQQAQVPRLARRAAGLSTTSRTGTCGPRRPPTS